MKESKERNFEVELNSYVTEITSTSGWSDESTVVYPEPKTRFGKLRRKIFLSFEEPRNIPSFAITVFVLFAVFVSTITFLISSLPEYWEKTPRAISIIEAICIAIFTTDYLTRAFTCPNWKWFIQPMNLIDLFAILPYYIELGLEGSVKSLAVIRVVRLLRIFRIVKVGKYASIFKVIYRSLAQSKDGLFMLLGLVSFAMLILSTLTFFAEQSEQKFDHDTRMWLRSDGSESPFQSIPATFWWCIVTMTTVGYGDAFPVSPAGKFVACITMLIGIMVLAFPISVIGTSFNETYAQYKESVAREKRKRRGQLSRFSRKKLDAAESPRQRKVELRKMIAKIHQRQTTLADKLKKSMEQMQEAQQLWSEMSELIDMLPTTTEQIDDDSVNQELDNIIVPPTLSTLDQSNLVNTLPSVTNDVTTDEEIK